MMSSVAYTKKIVLTALFVASGIVLQIIEQILPIFCSIPGGKLGLANVVTIAGILIFGGGYGISVAAIRSLLGCLLFGGISALPYSLFGALFSSIIMSCFLCSKQRTFSLIGIGIIGACTHNFAQILISSLLLKNGYVWTYLPVLFLLSVFSGGTVGVCAVRINRYLSAHKLTERQ